VEEASIEEDFWVFDDLDDTIDSFKPKQRAYIASLIGRIVVEGLLDDFHQSNIVH